MIFIAICFSLLTLAGGKVNPDIEVGESVDISVSSSPSKDHVSVLVCISCKYKSGRPKMFCQKGVIKKFAKFTGKHFCWSILRNI